MPTSTDLMGTGVPPGTASIVGNDPVLLAAAGTTQGGATTITSHLVEFTATGSDGIVLPSAAKIGTPYYIFNSSGSTGKVYVPSGHNLVTTSSTANGSLSMTTGQRAIFIQYKLKNWTYVLSA